MDGPSAELPALLRQLEAQVKAQEGQPDLPRLLLNRAFALQQLGLTRKALKDYEAVLELAPGTAQALLGRAKALVAVKQMEEAQASLEQLVESATLTTDLPTLAEARQLLAALAAGAVKQGARLPLLPAVAPPPPAVAQAQAQVAAPAAPAAKAPGLAVGFLGAAPKQQPKQQQQQHRQEEGQQQQQEQEQRPEQRPAPAAAAPAAPAGPLAAAAAAAAAEPPAAVDPLHRLLATAQPDQGVALAVQLVNGGQQAEAVALLDLLLQEHPRNVGGLAARGTARALRGQLAAAVADFSAAIEVEPRFHDFYKRRGQALSAMGDDDAATADLRQAIRLAPSDREAADTHQELGKVFQRLKDYRRAQAEFQAALAKGGAEDAALLGMLGLCQVSQGDLLEGIATYERAAALDPSSKDLALNLGMAHKEVCHVAAADRVLRRAAKLAGKGSTAVHAYRMLAQMRQGLGDHMGAVKDLNRAIAASDKEAQRIELRFLRGACHHAVGLHREAVSDYQAPLESQGRPGVGADHVPFLCLAFYQKEMALYARANLDRHVLSFCLDADMHPEFKELWCKKGPPSAEFVAMYRSIMQPQQPDWDAPPPPPPPQELFGPLLAAADTLGTLVQYSHQGFLPNARQQRMAGLAAIEYAQLLQGLAADRRTGRATLVDNAGASVSARAGPGAHALGWRDAMDAIVRWRQLAEPNDQVIWVDLLTEKEFNAGFGSHTPMFTGQTKCVRYYMNFVRALGVMKAVLAREGRAYDAKNEEVLLSEEGQAAAAAATTAQEMWEAIGADSWVVVPIDSSSRSGHTLEGTRLTVVKMGKGGGAPEDVAEDVSGQMANLGLANGVRGADVPAESLRPRPQPDAFEFSIRTPVTPARWKDYDEELGAAFERLAAALAAGDRGGAADAALRFAYYWYNFMPLARGSAFCGYVHLLGAFLAAGAPVRARMPQSYQTDWEAILEGRPERFIESVSTWMTPPELRAGSLAEEVAEAALPPPPPLTPPAEALPQVVDVLPTMRARLEALNGPDVPRV